MNDILNESNFISNVRILKENVLIFLDNRLFLFDLKFNQLDNFFFGNYSIKDLIIVNDKKVMIICYGIFFTLIIKDNKFEPIGGIKNSLNFQDVIALNPKISIFSFLNILKICENKEKSLKTASILNNHMTNNEASYLLGLDENSFIACNAKFICVYNIIKDENNFEKKNTFEFSDTILKIIKLSNKSLMVMLNNKICFLNLEKGNKVEQNLEYGIDVVKDFIIKIEDNIYMHKEKTLYQFSYQDNKLTLINKSKKDKSTILNELTNLYISKIFPEVKLKIVYNDERNKKFNENNEMKSMIYGDVINMDNQNDKSDFLFDIEDLFNQFMNHAPNQKQNKNIIYFSAEKIN